MDGETFPVALWLRDGREVWADVPVGRDEGQAIATWMGYNVYVHGHWTMERNDMFLRVRGGWVRRSDVMAFMPARLSEETR